MTTVHARDKDLLYFNWADKSRLTQLIESGAGACTTFTLLDANVVARSVRYNSLKYR
ncbi:MAG: hypothetical protein ACJ07L_09100 [Opitutales bacterium]